MDELDVIKAYKKRALTAEKKLKKILDYVAEVPCFDDEDCLDCTTIQCFNKEIIRIIQGEEN